MAKAGPDLTGKTFGRLLVVRMLAERTKDGIIQYLCRCDCSAEKTVPKGSLVAGYTKSCGCLNRENAAASLGKYGGHSRARKVYLSESQCYAGLIYRCVNPKSPDYEAYGGRGITVCDRWLRGEYGKAGFDCFLEDMGPKPSPDLSIDRIDNDCGYSKDNCQWASADQQAGNRRKHWRQVNGVREYF